MVTQWSSRPYDRRPEGGHKVNIDQVATATTAGGTTAVAARAGRLSVLLQNLDSSITIYYGEGDATLTSTDETGRLLAGESVRLYTDKAIKALSASGTPRLGYVEEYDD